ncbi:Threonine dehydrogenase and related Zn-dependent dehydrogenases [plant metagenome]
MKAARWHGAKDIRVERIAVPVVGPQEVKIEVAYCGICGNDLHEYIDGPHVICTEPHPITGMTFPVTLGHEYCGTVVEVGAEVADLQVGARVTVEPEFRCGKCHFCKRGQYNLCNSMGFSGLAADGGLARYAVIPSYMVYPIDDGVSFKEAAVMEPAAVALFAVRKSELKVGDSCAIFGAGPIGLFITMFAHLQGAANIVVIDPSAQRRVKAKELGASLVYDPTQTDAVAEIKKLTKIGVDVAFEAVGLQATLDGCMDSVRKDGTTFIVGLSHGRATFNALATVFRETKIDASVGYRHVYPELISLVVNKRVDLTRVITKIISIGDIVEEGFVSLSSDKRQVKVLIDLAGTAH